MIVDFLKSGSDAAGSESHIYSSDIVFKEPSSLSKNEEQEGWFCIVKRMEDDLENLLKNRFFWFVW